MRTPLWLQVTRSLLCQKSVNDGSLGGVHLLVNLDVAYRA
jgi:hypothetical protein